MAYNKFNELTRWQKFRLVGVSFSLGFSFIFLLAVIVKIIFVIAVWGFNLIPWA